MNALLVIALLLAPQVSPERVGRSDEGDERATVQRHPLSALERTARHLSESLRRGLHGDEPNVMILDLRRVYERNGWNSEPDLFSLDLMREVDAMPLWQVRRRLDTFTTRLADRYLLNEDQEQALQDLVARESNAFVVRHAPRFMPLFVEVLQTRLAGQPITAEQVARWTQDSEPLFEDSRRRLDLAAAEFMQTLDPEQQELVLVDLAAADNRLDRVVEMRAGWKRGEWQAADWGLDRDPVQRGRRPPDGVERPAPGGDRDAGGDRSLQPPMSDHPERAAELGIPHHTASRPVTQLDPWAKYVQDFIRRYKLDHAQQQRAWIIHRSACERRDFHQKRYDDKIERYRSSAVGDTEAHRRALAKLEESRLSTRQMIFEAMKRRLDRLPTRAQHRNAEGPMPDEPNRPAPVPADLSGP